jgi:hypothetical protein
MIRASCIFIVMADEAPLGPHLSAEIGALAAPVVLHRVVSAAGAAGPTDNSKQIDLSDAMTDARARLGSWPEFWSVRSQADYIGRRERYRAALILDTQCSPLRIR